MKSILFLALTLCLSTAVCAAPVKSGEWALAGKSGAKDIVPVAPKDGVVVSIVNPCVRTYFAKSRKEREVLFTNAAFRAEMTGWARVDQPVRLQWLWCGRYNPTLTVEVSEEGGERVFVGRTSAPFIDVPNLKLGAVYRWRVSGDPALRAEPAGGVFRTSSEGPRALSFPNVYNLRDLGGAVGLNGRRMKQGLVYRSAGFNDNAITFDRPESDWVPGARRMTDAETRELLRVTGIRTDIDLRNERECFGMSGSPLGETVAWKSCSSWAYGQLGEEKGKVAFVRVFRHFLKAENYPIVFHCITGADRTGTVAFLIGALVGVDLETLYRDWECTAVYSPRMDFYHARRLDQLVKVLSGYPGNSLAERTAAFIRDCGFTDADIAFVRDMLLESR